MTLSTVFLEIWLVILSINGMIFLVDDLTDDDAVSPLKTPLSLTTNITAVTQPNIFNNTDSTGTLIADINASNQNNATGGGGVVEFFDIANLAWNTTAFIIDLITGGFLWSTLALFGFPDQFIFILQGIIGFLMALTIFYFFTGR